MRASADGSSCGLEADAFQVEGPVHIEVLGGVKLCLDGTVHAVVRAAAVLPVDSY